MSEFDEAIERRLKRMLSVDDNDELPPGAPKVESQYMRPVDFLNEVNQFQKFIDRYFEIPEIFGEKGEKFPIISYMKIYDLIKLLRSNLVFHSTYTRDGLGGWMNILAIEKNERADINNKIRHIIPEHYKSPESKSYDVEMKQFGILRRYLDSLSAKKYIYTSFSEMGCLQYLHFMEFGEAFAFEWHAASRRKYVLTSISDIYKICNELKSTEFFLYNEEQLENLLRKFRNDEDIKPDIVMRGDKCSIEWVEFHTHDGIYYRKYELTMAMLRCYNHIGFVECAVPDKIKMVSDTPYLILTPRFKY